MPKKAKELSALEVKRLRHKEVDGLPKRALHAVGGVDGLYLQCMPPSAGSVAGARSWILRATIGHKRHDMGLGGFPDVTLAQARDKAREVKEQVRQGIDPVAERRVRQADLKREQGKLITFGRLAEDYLVLKASEFGGKNTRKQLQKVTTQLHSYAYPTLKDMIVCDISINDIESILKPIWLTKHTTANDVRIHIERIIDRAITLELYPNRNPASLKALRGLLPSPRGKKASSLKAQHRPALPAKQLPRFYDRAIVDGTIAGRALCFQILTATRPGEVRYAKWEDINFDQKLWRIPAEDMKMGEPHDVPLPDAAIEILKGIANQGSYIFSAKGDKPISDNTANQRIKALHREDVENGGSGFMDTQQNTIATAHGFRSTFKDWTTDQTKYRDELSEAALAHKVGDNTRRAYARSKQTEQRRPMMDDWASFCTSA